MMKFISVSQIIKSVYIREHADDLLQASFFHRYKEKKYIGKKIRIIRNLKKITTAPAMGKVGLVVGL